MYIIKLTYKGKEFMLQHIPGLDNYGINGCNKSYVITEYKRFAYKFPEWSDAEEYREMLPDEFEPTKIVKVNKKRRR